MPILDLPITIFGLPKYIRAATPVFSRRFWASQDSFVGIKTRIKKPLPASPGSVGQTINSVYQGVKTQLNTLSGWLTKPVKGLWEKAQSFWRKAEPPVVDSVARPTGSTLTCSCPDCRMDELHQMLDREIEHWTPKPAEIPPSEIYHYQDEAFQEPLGLVDQLIKDLREGKYPPRRRRANQNISS